MSMSSRSFNDPLISLQILFLLLMGCGSSSSSAHARNSLSPPPPPSAVTKNSKAQVPTENWIITGTLRLSVDSIEETLASIKKGVIQYQTGLTRSEWNKKRYNQSASLVLRIPSQHLSKVLGWLKTFGDVKYEQISKEEVTRQLIDHGVLVKNAKALLERLKELLKKEGIDVKDILEIEKEMDRLRSVIEKNQIRLAWLKDQVARATIKVYLEKKHIFIQSKSAHFYVSARGGLIHFDDADHLGFGVSLFNSKGAGNLHLDVDVIPEEKDKSNAFLLTFGGGSYSDFFGRGKRSFLNPYLGGRLGYAYLNQHYFVFGAEVGIELFKHEYVLINTHFQIFGLPDEDELKWLRLFGLNVGLIY